MGPELNRLASIVNEAKEIVISIYKSLIILICINFICILILLHVALKVFLLLSINNKMTFTRY